MIRLGEVVSVLGGLGSPPRAAGVVVELSCLGMRNSADRVALVVPRLQRLPLQRLRSLGDACRGYFTGDRISDLEAHGPSKIDQEVNFLCNPMLELPQKQDGNTVRI